MRNVDSNGFRSLPNGALVNRVALSPQFRENVLFTYVSSSHSIIVNVMLLFRDHEGSLITY